MESHQYPPLHTLSEEEQSAIERQVSRIKKEFGFQQEMLSLDDLSKIIGKKINYLWNIRNRGQMPSIPVRRIGGHDTYWIVHVVMWMMRGQGETSEAPVKQRAPAKEAASDGEFTPSVPRASRRKKSIEPAGKGRTEGMSAAKQALLARGLAILQERNKSAS